MLGGNPGLAQPSCEKPLAKAAAGRNRSRNNLTTPVPKQTKTEQTNGSAAPAAESSSNGEAITEPKKRTRTVKTGAKKSAAKKTGTKPSAKKSTTRRSSKKSTSYEPSEEDIRLRAYFIAARRGQMSIAGDSAQDWRDARQQLIEESGERRA